MGTNVFANNSEICSKAASGMTAGAMPDPCFTPPPTPAGVEVVVPYPNTAQASDLDKGSEKVLICNKEAALEDSSYMKTSVGNEAAKPSTMQGGVVTKTTKGKAFFAKWSNDVKFEGKGVCRHSDLTTHNHWSKPGHCVPMIYTNSIAGIKKCFSELKKIKNECKSVDEYENEQNVKVKDGKIKIPRKQCSGVEHLPSEIFDNKTRSGMSKEEKRALKKMMLPSEIEKFKKIAESIEIDSNNILKTSDAMKAITAHNEKTVDNNPCLKASRCILQKFSDTKNTSNDSNSEDISCCPGQTGHHVIPTSMADHIPCLPDRDNAPVVCVEGVLNSHGTHGKIHANMRLALGEKEGTEIDCTEVFEYASTSMLETFPGDCSKDCVEAQLNKPDKKKCSGCKGAKVVAKSGLGGRIRMSKK